MAVGGDDGAAFADAYRRLRFDGYVALQKLLTSHETAFHAMAAMAMALVTAVLAQVEFLTPLSPVPYTGQVLGVAVTAGLLGRSWGTASVGLYVTLGILGLPVFAGQWAGFDAYQFGSGWDLFVGAAGLRGLSAGFLLGFVAQAWLVGTLVDREARGRRQTMLAFGATAVLGLLALAALDVFALANYNALFPASPARLPNVWFALTLGTLLVGVAAMLWLAVSTKARRERVELLMANLVGLLALYALGAVWFLGYWTAMGYGPLDFATLVRFTVLAFLPADLTKILLAVGLLTLVRPTARELSAKSPEEARSPDVH